MKPGTRVVFVRADWSDSPRVTDIEYCRGTVVQHIKNSVIVVISADDGKEERIFFPLVRELTDLEKLEEARR